MRATAAAVAVAGFRFRSAEAVDHRTATDASSAAQINDRTVCTHGHSQGTHNGTQWKGWSARWSVRIRLAALRCSLSLCPSVRRPPWLPPLPLLSESYHPSSDSSLPPTPQVAAMDRHASHHSAAARSRTAQRRDNHAHTRATPADAPLRSLTRKADEGVTFRGGAYVCVWSVTNIDPFCIPLSAPLCPHFAALRCAAVRCVVQVCF